MQNSLVIVTFFFRPDTSFLGNFGPKKQNCQLKLKLVTWTNSNTENSMLVFTFPIFDRKNLGGKFGPKKQNCQFKPKFIA